MPRERKFDFFPVKEEKYMVPDTEAEPYVRIQKPGLLVFPRITLDHFEIKLGDVVYMQFFADYGKRALGFKFMTKFTPEQVKEFKVLKVSQYRNTGLMGMVSIKKILNQFKDWKQPTRLKLEQYTDQDEMMTWIGKLNYIIIPKAEGVVVEGNTSTTGIRDAIQCPSCEKVCLGKGSLAQHRRQNH